MENFRLARPAGGVVRFGCAISFLFVLFSTDPVWAGEPTLEVLGTWGGAVNAVDVDPANPDVAYIGSGRRFVILDVSDPANVSEIGSIDLGNIVSDLKVRDGYAYVATFGRPNYFCIVNVTSLAAPQLVWSYTASSNFNAAEVDLYGNTAFVRGGPSSVDVNAFDITDPLNPVLLGRVIQSIAQEAEIVGNLLYLIDDFGHVRIYDLSLPWLSGFVNNSRLQQVGMVTLPGSEQSGRAIAVDGDYIYAAQRCCEPLWDGRVSVIDATTLAQPSVIDNSADFARVEDIAVSDGYAFIADSEELGDGYDLPPPRHGRGLAIFDIATDRANPTLVGTYRTHGQVTHVTVVGARAYVRNKEGLDIVDVSNPADPHLLGRLHGPRYLRNVTQDGTLLYVTDEFYGFTILDISNPRTPRVVGAYQTPLDGDHHGSWELALDTDRQLAFLSSGWYGIRAVDVSDPTQPILAGSFAFSDPSDEARAVALSGTVLHLGMFRPCPDEMILGLFVNLDVTDPTSIDEMGRTECIFNSPTTIRVRPDRIAFCALSIDGEGGSQLTAVDTSNPFAPFEVTPGGLVAGMPDVDLIGGTGNQLALADDTPGDQGGLRLFEASDPPNAYQFSWAPGTSATGVAVRGDRAYLCGGVSGRSNRLRVFDIANISNPVELGEAFIQDIFRVKIDPRGVACVTTRQSGLVLVDVREGPTGDLNADGCTDLVDLAAQLSHFGCTRCVEGDLDMDGDVDLSDLAALLAHFGDCDLRRPTRELAATVTGRLGTTCRPPRRSCRR